MQNRTCWNVKNPVPMPAFSDSRQGSISPLVASLLSLRGIQNPEDQEAFLFHKDLAYLSSPYNLPDIQQALDRITAAIKDKEAIVVYGDYDVDGMTATALLTQVLKKLGANVDYWIPERQGEGYGLNKDVLQHLKETGAGLIITVDCGISAVTEALFAKEIGLDLVITDHHQPPEILPEAHALINPKLAATPGKDYDLAGVGVAFKLALALCEAFKRPELAYDYLDLVAIGTVADLVALTGDNRILVYQGLIRINASPRPGVAALLNIAGLTEKEVSTGSIAFGLAPRLNASGRLTHGSYGVELLMAPDLTSGLYLARELNEANQMRQDIENKIMEEALSLLADFDFAKERIIVLASDRWHPGVIGIVASRLTEKFHRPALLISITDQEGKGSGRSIAGFNLYEALKNCSFCLSGFGGHEMAAGFSIAVERIEEFRQIISAYANERLTENDMIPVKTADMILNASLLTIDLVKEIRQMAPFGVGNPQPVFILSNVRICKLNTVGTDKNHLKFNVKTGKQNFSAIAFNMGSRLTDLQCNQPVDLMFIPEINSWNNKEKLQLNVKDIRLHEDHNENAGLSFIDRLFITGSLWQLESDSRDIPEKESFYTKVIGIAGKEHKDTAFMVQTGEAVTLQFETENAAAGNTVAVYYKVKQIGYLNTEVARHLVLSRQNGNDYGAYVAQVTGDDKDTRDINLYIYRKEKCSRSASNSWQNLSASEKNEVIRQAILGNRPYREKQIEALQALEEGHNTLLILGTGRGKSAVFQTMAARFASALGITILVYPLRSLVNDQYNRFREILDPLGIGVEAATGVLSPWERKDFFKSLYNQQIQVILTTPEFLEIHWEKFLPVSQNIRFLVIDEAHHIEQSNRSGYKNLGETWQRLGSPLVLAATATANEQTAEKISQIFNIKKLVAESHCRENLQIVDARLQKDKLTYLLKLLDDSSRCIIYVNSRRQAYELATLLRSCLPCFKDRIGFYHGGMDRKSRQIVEKMFRQGEINVLVSTSAFGEGIDIPDIRDVVLYHLCFSKAEYNQLAGRAGRDGQEARIHLLYNQEDQALNQLLLQMQSPDRETLGRFYLYLRELAKAKNPITLTNREIALDMKYRGFKPVSEQAVPACLGILEELELLLREQDSGRRYIHLAPPPPMKLDLASSARYMEGQHELMAYQEYIRIAFSDNLNLLLDSINRPIIPEAGIERRRSHGN